MKVSFNKFLTKLIFIIKNYEIYGKKNLILNYHSKLKIISNVSLIFLLVGCTYKN